MTLQELALQYYSSPYGKPNPEMYAFLKGLEIAEQAWKQGVKWGDANCEFGGETSLPKFDE